jgi:starvation-inducible DNA-binding protein
MSSTVHTGISPDHRKAVADQLSKVLASTYTLYLETQNFHWNVKGPFFASLHLLFEQQYTEYTLAIDAIAERIRALGFDAPASYQEFAALSVIADPTGPKKAMEMVAQLKADNEALIQLLRATEELADEADDEVTTDLINGRLQAHEKNAWMLRTILEE